MLLARDRTNLLTDVRMIVGWFHCGLAVNVWCSTPASTVLAFLTVLLCCDFKVF